jgi:hypothetical protein
MMAAVAAIRILTSFSEQLNPIALFTPIGAMALFGGAYFNGRLKPFAFPLLTLFASDLILSFTVYSSMRSGLLYSGWYWTYGAFALMSFAGKWIIKDVNVKSVLIACISITLIHWLISDIGPCIFETGNQPIIAFYLSRLITAIPYELKFLAGTLVYGAVMFGSFELMKKKYAVLSL